MKDTLHLVALQTRLFNERARLAAAKTEKEKQARQVIVNSAEREFEGELKFLGMDSAPVTEINDDDLLAELGL